MYIPDDFKIRDQNLVASIVQQHPLATVITVTQDHEPIISHAPLVLMMEDNRLSLFGHFSKANMHWQTMQKNPETKVIFHGPNAYITPKWYRENDVPTWNYAVVHFDGKARLIEDRAGIVNCLKLLADLVESPAPDAWNFSLPEDLSPPNILESAIVGFEIDIINTNAKFKLSQNRSAADRLGVVAGLETRTDDMSQKIRELMVLSN